MLRSWDVFHARCIIMGMIDKGRYTDCGRLNLSSFRDHLDQMFSYRERPDAAKCSSIVTPTHSSFPGLSDPITRPCHCHLLPGGSSLISGL